MMQIVREGNAADTKSKATNAGPVRLAFLGYTNEPAKGRLATFNLTNSQNHDIIHGYAVEEKTQTGWPVYTNGGSLRHSVLEQLDAQTNITFSVAVPTNGRTWRVSVIYQNLQTRHDEDFGDCGPSSLIRFDRKKSIVDTSFGVRR